MVAEQPIVPDVVVSEPVAAKLAHHLHEQGRLQGGVPMVIASLNRAVERKWGVAADHFTDQAGPGWIIDISDYFDNELLYAIVRREHGNRSVVAVVTEEEVGEFKKTGKWSSSEARAGGLSDVVDDMVEGDGEMTEAEAPVANVRALPQRRPPFVPPVKPQPNDPRLIVWTERPEGGGDEAHLQVRRCAYSEVQNLVMKLLMQGHEVEVWSGVKKPELKVDL